MRETIRSGFLAAVVLCSLIGTRVSASHCYPDYCQNLTHLIPTPGFQCILTPVQRGEGCAKLKFEDTGKLYKRDGTAIFTLHAYVKNDLKESDDSQRVTAFNLSISDVNFHRLITRYQNIIKNDENACRHVELLHGNASHPTPKDFYVSCPFSDASYEGYPYCLEYLAIGKNFVYSRKYVFHVPQHELIEDSAQVQTFTPFVYIDVSDPSNAVLYIQPLPPTYNVTEYKAWLIHNDTKSTIATAIIPANRDRGHARHNFSAPDGVYYVNVAALHPDCGEHGCANSTSPYIDMKHASHQLLIMIISLIWIPPVLLYALYHVFKLYRKRVLKRMAMKPNCLVVYSPTHPSHVNVMAEFTKYLRYCHINAMIDVFDIAETASKDPGLWCNTAFQAADVVLVATSPPPTFAKSDATIVYRNVDNHLLRLLKENYPRRNKRYYAIHLPYCKPDHIPEEARLFKKFRIPEDLTRLVKRIHGIVCLGFYGSSSEELLESIRFATAKISEDEAASAMKNTEETDDLLPPIVVRETAKCDAERPIEIRRPGTPDSDVIPQSFTTRIDELNLLGEIDEEKTFVANSTRNDCEFRIDKLNL
ncbi:PREDICTED: uncharacterized protein LOC105459973 [Wasmannia auropunctata]|uniref:uncharacterized protein LOC105459973 n=1 Tax=Wasmannia auropunctata TaxID=64793 RepID=UPI0005EF8C30|nr:PREDICTED: uncharacterized protein LOC105459973 [Wasmannia auropunctata]